MFVNDDIDLYKETIIGDQYLYDGNMVDLDVSHETIHVAGGADVEFEVRSTLHGPLISDSVSMWWTYMKYPENLIQEAFYGLSRAEKHGGGSTCCVFGSLARIECHAWGHRWKYRVVGFCKTAHSILLQLTPNPYKTAPLRRMTSLGWYDFSKNPQTINPESGFVFSTNNSPEDVDGVHYPGYYYAGNTRAASIIQALSSDKSDWTMEDSQEMQMGTHSPVYERNCGMMCAYASGNNFEGVYAEYFEKMKDWRGTHGMEEVEPTIYYRWMHAVIKDVFKDAFG